MVPDSGFACQLRPPTKNPGSHQMLSHLPNVGTVPPPVELSRKAEGR
jgi:hypothetical protein